MAHKTQRDGTAYEISGGKTLIGGTAYEISGGKTLVDGTAYEVGFAKEFVTVDDLGELLPTKNFVFSYYSKTANISELPTGLAKCTHLSIDGVILECEIYTSENDGVIEYSFCVGLTSSFISVKEGQYCLKYGKNTSGNLAWWFYAGSSGPYSVKIGFLA